MHPDDARYIIYKRSKDRWLGPGEWREDVEDVDAGARLFFVAAVLLVVLALALVAGVVAAVKWGWS